MSKEQAETMSTTLTYTHLWTIYNFSYLYDEACQWKWAVESEESTVPGNEDLTFSCRIDPKVNGEDGEFLEVGTTTHKIPAMWKGKVKVKERRCIVDENGRELWCKDYNLGNHSEREVFANRRTADDEYMPVEELHHPLKSYLKGGTLRMQYELTLCSPEAIFTVPGNAHTSSFTSIPVSVSSLSHSLTLSHFKWLCADSSRQMPFCVESQYFAPEREDIGKMRLGYYPKGNDAKYSGMIGIFNENTDSLLVHYEFFLLDAKGEKCHPHGNTYQMLPNFGKFFPYSRHHLLSLLDSLPTDELTINCHVTVLGKGEQEKAHSPQTTPTISTHLDLALFTFHYVSFTWTIEQFLAQLTRDRIVSSAFSPSSDSPYRFALKLYPNQDNENVILTLCFVSPYSIEESTVDWRHSVVDAKEDEWNVSYDTDIIISKPAESNPHNLIPHQTLSNFASLLPEGKLTIKCEIWIHEPRKELPPELRNPPQDKDSGFLISDFASQPEVFQEEIPRDPLTFILTDANNEKIHIERADLHANAPEMAAIFSDGNEFKLMQVRSQPFAVFANFCKDGAIRKNEDVDSALDFFKKFKRQYEIELLKLKGSIERILILSLEVNIVWDIFRKAADNDLKETMDKVLQFIRKNGLRKGDDYQRFMSIPHYAKYLEVKVNVN